MCFIFREKTDIMEKTDALKKFQVLITDWYVTKFKDIDPWIHVSQFKESSFT